jgi:hypothetical protein
MTCSILINEFNGYLANLVAILHPWLEPIIDARLWGSDQRAVSRLTQRGKRNQLSVISCQLSRKGHSAKRNKITDY